MPRELFTISVQEGTKQAIKEAAHFEQQAIGEFVTSVVANKVCYVAQYSENLFKIGVSHNPFEKASKFGKLVLLINHGAAQALREAFPTSKAPEDTLKHGGRTEWVKATLEEIQAKAIELDACAFLKPPSKEGDRVGKHITIVRHLHAWLEKAGSDFRIAHSEIIEAGLHQLSKLSTVKLADLLKEAKQSEMNIYYEEMVTKRRKSNENANI